MKFTDEQIAQARANTAGALEAAGYLNARGEVFCPRCTSKGAKQQINSRNGVFGENGAVIHWKCGFRLFSGIDALVGSKYDEDALLVEEAWTFADAVNYLTGVSTESHPAPASIALRPALKKQFTAVCDTEVYEAVLGAGDIEAAVEFYGQWGISADAVRRARCVVITDMAKLRDAIMPFGTDRLIACGVAMEPHEDTGFAGVLVNGDYPVIEPQLGTDGLCRSMQFRAANHMAERIAAHKVWKQESEEAKEAGTKHTGVKAPFVSKFLSLRGASTSDRPGFGSDELAELVNLGQTKDDSGEKKTVVIVEGLKDCLAVRSGQTPRLAYGLPGAGMPLSVPVARLLQHFKVEVSLDGDEAGEMANEGLFELLEHHGFDVEVVALPDGKDHTDLLVEALQAC